MEEEKESFSLSESNEQVPGPVHSIARADSHHSFNSDCEEAWISIEPKANEDSIESSRKLSEIMSILLSQQNKHRDSDKLTDNIGKFAFLFGITPS